MIEGLDNGSVVDNRVDNSGSVVDNRVDSSGVVGVSEGVDDTSSVVHRVDSSEWGVGESGVDKSGISFGFPLVNHVGESRVTTDEWGSVADSWTAIVIVDRVDHRASIADGADS